MRGLHMMVVMQVRERVFHVEQQYINAGGISQA
jgi:hypothetical protein